MLRNLIVKAQQNSQRLNAQKCRFLQQNASSATHNPPPQSANSNSKSGKLQQEHIEEAIKITPTLASVSPELWRRAHAICLNHGLGTTQFLQIVTGNPAVLARAPQRIVESLEHWRSCQFGEKMLHQLITKYPELLNVSDGHMLRKHVTYLKSFAATDKNIWKLLMNCPNLMEQSAQSIDHKIDYLTQVMRLQIPEIVKSEALSKPLAYIRCRHVFLARLGLFKPRSLRADPDEPTKNNRLYQITDTSEKTFATKICHITLAEYEAFKELYEREQLRKRREADSDDEFSDDDEDEN